MSSKRKKEDKEKNVGVAVTPDTPEAKELIPNRVSEAMWEQWSQWDELSENVADVINMIVERSWEELDYHHRARQLIPATVEWAMMEMMEVIEWNFLKRDFGDCNLDQTIVWKEEQEPIPCQLDAWTRGKVPIRNKPITSPSLSPSPPPPPRPPSQHSSHRNESPIYPMTEESECVSEDLASNLEDQIIPKPPLQPKSSVSTRGSSRTKAFSHQSGRTTTPPQKHQLEIRTVSEATSFPAPPMDTTLHSLLTQSTDQYLKTHKIGPVPSKRLPANRVTPTVNILQPAATCVSEPTRVRQSNTFTSKHGPIFSPVPEPLIEKMDPSPGVSIIQGDVIKRGPRALWNIPSTTPHTTPLRSLEPIKPSDIMAENTPQSVYTHQKNDVMT